MAILARRDGETLAQLHNQSCPLRKIVDTTGHSTTTDHHLPDGQKDTLTN